MENAWPPVRMIGIAVAMAAGIAGSELCGRMADAPVPWACAIAVVLAAVPWRRVRGRAIACVAVAALVGAALAARERATVPDAPAGVDDRTEDVVTGTIAGAMTESPGWVFAILDVDASEARVVLGMDPVDAHAVLPGDRVRVRGRLQTPRGYRNPGGIDRRQSARDRGGDLQMSADEIEVIERAAVATPWRWATRTQRAGARVIAARGGDAAGNAIVRAAVVGDRSAVLEETNEGWRAAGIYHALSVSGMHLAVVAMLLFWLVRRGWAAIPALAMRVDPGRVAAAVAAPAAIAYTLATGGQTATIRALVVVLAILGGVAMRRRLVVLDAVGLAAALILATRPSALGDPSFQLSFTAAITLCVLPRRQVTIEARPRLPARMLRWILGALRVSIAVTATTAPITAWHFHQFAVGGVVGNLVLGPVVELFVIPAGLAGLLLDAGPILDASIVAAGLVDRGARVLGAAIPVLEVPPPRLIEILAWYVALAGVWRWRRRGAAAIVALGLAVGIASIAWSCVEPRTRDTLHITFVDVGQGDAAVIELPGGAVWLVDAGGNPADPAPTRHGPGDALLRYLRSRRIAHIDVAILSHPHPDHYLGLLALAGRVSIDELWIARPAGPDPAPPAEYAGFAQVAAILERHGTRVVHPPLGVARRDHGVALDVLGPIYDDGDGALPVAAADPVRSVNDDSLVVALAFAGRRVIFLGDVEREGEDTLVAAGAAFADVVKVAHHGSPTSSSPELVAAAHARLAVISCGRANRFGFPAPAVVTRWQASGAAVLETSRDGAITIEIAPSGELRVQTYD